MFSGSHTFPYQSLLLSTTILNDTCNEILKDEKQHDAVDKSTSKQQVCIYGSRLRCAKNWTHTPSASGSYGRPADESLVVLKNFLKL